MRSAQRVPLFHILEEYGEWVKGGTENDGVEYYLQHVLSVEETAGREARSLSGFLLVGGVGVELGMGGVRVEGHGARREGNGSRRHLIRVIPGRRKRR